MTRFRSSFARLLLILPLWALLCAGTPYLPPTAAHDLQSLLGDVALDAPLPSGLIVDGLQIDRDRAVFIVSVATPHQEAARLALLPRDEAAAGPDQSASFTLQRSVTIDEPRVGALLDHLQAEIVARDRGGIYVVPAPPPAPPPVAIELTPGPVLDVPGDLQVLVVIALVLLWLLLYAAWLAHRGRLERGARWYHARRTHLLPAALQVVIFTYWGLYWRDLLPIHAPIIALEVVAAVLIDAALTLRHDRRLQLSTASLPVALSTNLFVIFQPTEAWLTVLAICIALGSKRWFSRDGRHIFNPSAFGLTCVGMLTLAVPRLASGDSAHIFSLAPNLTEVVLLLALVVQVRVPVVLVSIGTFLGLRFAHSYLGLSSFEPTWAPVALVVTLLVTDPATQPRAPLGRLVFGFGAGLTMAVLAWGQDFYNGTDQWAKVAGVGVANFAAPWVDGAVRRIPARWLSRLSWLDQRWNRAHIACFWLLMVSGLAFNGKGDALQATYGIEVAHVANSTAFVVVDPDGRRVSCADNAIWCQPFTFAGELRCWLDDGDPSCGPGRHGWRGPAPGVPD